MENIYIYIHTHEGSWETSNWFKVTNFSCKCIVTLNGIHYRAQKANYIATTYVVEHI
jgi:hypothetical protein